MSSLQRRVGMLILIALVITPFMVFAQDDSATAVGSGIPAPLIQAFASAANTPLTMNVTGTDAGFSTFCQGAADITGATRAISADEESACQAASVNFLEFILGYDIMAVVSNPATDFGTCLTTDQLNSLFAPSSTATNWNQVGAGNADIPLSLNLPPDNTTPYALLDSLVEGVGLRSDATRLADDAAVIDAVRATNGALGVVRLPEAQAAGDKVNILQLNTTEVGCAAPSAETAEGRAYTGAYRLFTYANAATIDKTKPLFEAAFGDGSAEIIAAQGFVAPTDAVYAQNQAILENNMTGRQFSKDVTAFNIPANLVGTLNIDGAASGRDYVTAVTNAFVQQYAGVTLNHNTGGLEAGITGLCNGELDLINTFGDLTPEQQANCDANNIPTQSFHLGNQAVAILGNGDFLTCLTTQQLATVWQATAEKTVTNWNQVDPNFPDMPIVLVAPAVGDPFADLMMIQATGQSAPTREDFAETKSDPNYRATAVSDTPGALTYMSWSDFQSLASTPTATLVAIDGGSGCVTPSNATIADGTYPLARSLTLVVNQLSLARPEVQSLLWFIASDANYPLLASNGYQGVDFAKLPDLRDSLQQSFDAAYDAAREAARRAGEATPQATSEATAEATSEATPEATAAS